MASAEAAGLNRLTESRQGLKGDLAAEWGGVDGFQPEQQRQLRVVVEHVDCGGGQLSGTSELAGGLGQEGLLLRPGLVRHGNSGLFLGHRPLGVGLPTLAVGVYGCGSCCHCQQRQRDPRRPRRPHRPPMLTHLLGLQVVFRHTPHRRRHIRHHPPKTRITQIQLHLIPSPTQINPPRLLRERRQQRRRNRRPRTNRTRRLIPHEPTLGQHRQNPLRILVLQPIRHLPVHPRRLRRIHRQQQNEPLRRIQRRRDRRPQVRIRRQTGLIPEHPNRPPPPPRLGEPLQRRLQPRRQQPIRRMRIRNERIHTPTHPRPLTRHRTHRYAHAAASSTPSRQTIHA